MNKAIRDLIITQLQGDAPLGPSTFPGGVWSRLPRIGTGQSATPGAFYTQVENPAEAGKLKPVIVVTDGGNNPSPGGVAHNGFVAFPLVRGYAFNSPSGEEALDLLEQRVRALFPSRGRSYSLATGRPVKLKALERMRNTEADDFGYPGRIFTDIRVEGTFVN